MEHQVCITEFSNPDFQKEKALLDNPYVNEHAVEQPKNLEDLIQHIDEVFSHDNINVEYLQTLMSLYRSNRSEWQKYAKSDPHKYTRNLVAVGNGKYNLMLLCWNEGQGSSIHDHTDAHCFMKVLEGSVKETQYFWPEHENETLKKKKETLLELNCCAYINDSIGLHRVENPSHVDPAVTLHLYIPPYSECRCFDENTGKTRKAQVTFWSKYGERTDLEKPESATADFSAESETSKS